MTAASAYSLIHFDAAGRPTGRTDLTCATDEEAFDAISDMTLLGHAQLWRGDTFVCEFKPSPLQRKNNPPPVRPF